MNRETIDNVSNVSNARLSLMYPLKKMLDLDLHALLVKLSHHVFVLKAMCDSETEQMQ